MQVLNSFREYIDALAAIGEIQRVGTEVDWNLEMGAITRRCNELGAPAPLFERVKGIAPGFRALGAPAGVSSQAGLRLARVAVSLGMDAATPARDIVEAFAQARTRSPIPPVRVQTGPCKEAQDAGRRGGSLPLPDADSARGRRRSLHQHLRLDHLSDA